MSLYLYGIIEEGNRVDFGPIGFEKGGGQRERVEAVPFGNLAVVSAPAPKVDFAGLPRKEMIAHLLAHQQTLEEVMKRFFVLPFKFGTIVRKVSELDLILERGSGFLKTLAEKMRDLSEIDVVATWEVPQILREISAEDPEVVAFQKNLSGGTDNRIELGMMLAGRLKARAEKWRDEILNHLKSSAEGCAGHDLLNDQMVLNASFLVSNGRREAFDHAVLETDRKFAGKLQFRCVGPLPPYSFATLTLRKFDPEKIGEAAEILKLNGVAELTDIKRRYKELSRLCHPDTHPDQPQEVFESLQQAFELMAGYCEDGPKSLEREAVASCIRLTVLQASDPVGHAA